MTALLTENLPLLAGAPNGIKKLRELILELAVRGKLVPQDPSDEPANELLQRIAEEKERLVAEGKIKKQKPLAGIAEVEKLFELPLGWSWARLASIGVTATGGTPSTGNPVFFGGDLPFIGPGQINSAGQIFDPEKWLTELARSETTIAKPKDILMVCIGGSIGKGAVADRELAFNQQINSISVLLANHRYVFNAISGPGFQDAIKDAATGSATPIINRTKWDQLLVSLPPLAEQHRIVAKVDELMALCDRLEAQQADAESAHSQLVQALLDNLTQASDATDFAASWQRLAEHFHTLFSNEFAIDALKKAVLQLAVIGKLVPQDYTDEPASELLSRIEEEKQRLVDEAVVKKNKKTVESTTVNIKLELPSAWKWVSLLEITTGMDSGWSPSCLGNCSPSDDVWGVLKTTAVQVMSYLEHENKELPSHLEPRPEAEVKVGDILFTRAGPINRVGISCLVESTRPKLMISDKIIRFHPVELGVDGRFLALCLNTGETAKYLEQAKSGMAASQVNISQEKLRLAPIPLAPIREQHRIVKKVDQLMKLCDTLKQQINLARSKQTELLDTLMAQV